MAVSPEPKSTRWTNEQTKTFLHHLSQYPCLWPEQPTTKKKRMRAKKRIAVALGMHTKVVHQKIITLTGQYERETKRRAMNPARWRYEWYDEAEFLAQTEKVEFLETADKVNEEASASTECNTKLIHSQMCRVCLVAIDDPNALLFQEFSTKFSGCTGFAGSYVDQPTLICSDCRDELLVCWTFLDRAKQTELVLQQNLLPEGTTSDSKPIKSDIQILDQSTEPSQENDETMELAIEALESYEGSPQEPKPVDSKNIVCPVCGKCFYKYRLNDHLAMVHTDANVQQRFICDKCGRNYKCKNGLIKHLRNHTNDNRYQCQFCDKKFLNWGARRFHIRSKHMVDKPFHCHLCGKGFLTKKYMNDHILGDHSNATWECTQCDKTFRKKINFQTHVKTVHDADPKVLACNVCGKEFKMKRYLKQHYVTHTGEKNYVCPVERCRKAFAQNHVLRTHVEKMHPEAIDELPPPGTIVSVKAIERLKEMQNIDYVKTDEIF